MFFSKQRGFSLIELLVVVAIIAVLAAVGVVGYTKYIFTTKIAVNEANAVALAKAVAVEITKPTICADIPDLEGLDYGRFRAVIDVTGRGQNPVSQCINKLLSTGNMKNPFTGLPYGVVHGGTIGMASGVMYKDPDIPGDFLGSSSCSDSRGIFLLNFKGGAFDGNWDFSPKVATCGTIVRSYPVAQDLGEDYGYILNSFPIPGLNRPSP
jgi:prepilin-type N-terminal cleavage/methylation domain-containing protein